MNTKIKILSENEVRLITGGSELSDNGSTQDFKIERSNFWLFGHIHKWLTTTSC